VEPRPPLEERLAARLGRQARARPPLSRAKRIAWIAFGLLVLGLAVGYAVGWVRPGYLDRLERDVRERQERER
jgi:hypothetical protein